ncbi:MULTISPECIES: HNH endonuclease [Cupriavidus]|nr:MULTISPECIES: HNH endonuclease signature motif containing protein [Cupriavidus]
MSTTADEILGILLALGAPAVVTKNKHPESEGNYRPRARHPGDMLDGYWPGRPSRVSPGSGFAIHFVERHNRLWLGAYLGSREREPDSGIFSLIVGDVQCFEIGDLNLDNPGQRGLRKILKQEGAMTYSYFDPASFFGDVRGRHTSRYLDTHIDQRDGPTYAMVQVKQRLQQKAFRKAVFGLHESRCVITGCDIPEMLEAAHLEGRSWQSGDNAAQDGIPLRVDLHRAYDAGLLKLDDQHRIIELDECLREAYGLYMVR